MTDAASVAEFVFDTSGYLNGWRDHYPPKTFGGVWKLVGNALADGRIVLPREVFREIGAQDDDVKAFIDKYASKAIDPSAALSRTPGFGSLA